MLRVGEATVAQGPANYFVPVTSEEDLERDVQSVLAWKYRERPDVDDDDGQVAPQDVYRHLMNNDFAPALRAAGLRGSGGRFELPSRTHWVQLGFQKSSYSDRIELRFTINLFVVSRADWVREAARSSWLGSKPSPLSGSGGVVGEWARIGALLPTVDGRGGDTWWSLFRGVDPGPVQQDVLDDLRDYAVPWLKQRAS
jgi:hypothetical protein